jgi:soluble lytic murein transglycosylase
VLPYRYSLPLLALLILVICGEVYYLNWKDRQPKENRYDPMIVAVAHETGVDPFLLRALIWRESRFNPSIYGLAQEHGLMQVTPAVGEAWAKANKIPNFQPSDLFDPLTNIRAGAWYLSHAIHHWDQTDDPIPFALAEYNAGRTNALKWVDPNDPQNHLAFMNRITFPTTRKYVEVILEKRDEYQVDLANNRWYKPFVSSDQTMTQTQTP